MKNSRVVHQPACLCKAYGQPDVIGATPEAMAAAADFDLSTVIQSS